MSLSLPQRLALVKYLTEMLTKLRTGELVPEAVAEWAPGARIPVKFGTELAGWASVPKPSVRASVVSDEAFTAWVAEHHPHQIEVIERPYASFTKAVLEAAKKNGGYWVNGDTGEKIPIPGIRVGDGDPYTKVDLADNAGEIIARAWRAGDVSFTDLLALEASAETPAPDVPPPPAPPDLPEWVYEVPGRPDLVFADEHGFLNPELAAWDACYIQGGYSTPPIEAYRMLRDASRSDDGIAVERVLGWLQDHGLDPADPREGKDTPWPLPERGDAA